MNSAPLGRHLVRGQVAHMDLHHVAEARDEEIDGVGDARVIAIPEAARELDRLRENWLNPPDATDADLKKRTLTNFYTARPTWLATAHATLDRAVWAAYAWPSDEIPADVPEDVILSRPLALNGERAGS